MIPPTPTNEEGRLEALRRYQILDSVAEPAFDDLAALASYICDTPISLVTLIDANRQWLKSKVGLEVNETSRDISFCGHAILTDDLMIVEDARADPRFADNPFVAGDPNIRFYAGSPLQTADGYALGSLCVIDRASEELPVCSPAEVSGRSGHYRRSSRLRELMWGFSALRCRCCSSGILGSPSAKKKSGTALSGPSTSLGTAPFKSFA